MELAEMNRMDLPSRSLDGRDRQLDDSPVRNKREPIFHVVMSFQRSKPTKSPKVASKGIAKATWTHEGGPLVWPRW
jgi:hypothetical protein